MGRARRLRYRHLRRTVIAAPAALAVFLLVVLLLWRTLESERLCAFSARRIERTVHALSGARLEIGHLRWGLFPLRVELEETTLESTGVRFVAGRAIVEVAGLRVASKTLVIDSLAIQGLEVELREPVAREGEEARRSPFRMILRHLDIRDVTLSGSKLPGRVSVAVDELEMSWVGDRVETAGWVSAREATLDGPGIEPFSFRPEARFERRGGEIRLPTVRVTAPGVSLGGSAVVAPEYLTARADGDIDLAELDRLIHVGGLLQGEARVEVKFDSRAREPARADIEAARLVVSKFPLENFRAELSLSSEGLHGEVSRATFFGGSLAGSYHLGRLGAPYPHRVRGTCRSLDLASFLEAIGVPSGGMAARADIEAGVGWESSRFPLGTGSATARFTPIDGPLPVDGLLHIELLPPGLLQFQAEELKLGASVATIEGPLRLKTWEPEWAIHLEPAVMGEILPAINRWVGSAAIPESITGVGAGDVRLSGPWNRLHAGFRLDCSRLSLPPIELDRAIIEAAVGDGAWSIQQGRFLLGDGSGEVRGTLRWDAGAGDEGLDLRFEGRQLSLSRIASWLGVDEAGAEGSVAFTGGLGGSLAQPRGSWALGLVDVEVAGQELGDGSAMVDLSGGAFTLGNLEFENGLGGGLRWHVGDEIVAGELGWAGMKVGRLPPALTGLFGDAVTWDLSFVAPLTSGRTQGSLDLATDRAQVKIVFDEAGVTARGGVSGAASGALEIVYNGGGSGWQGRGEFDIESAGGVTRLLAPDLDIPFDGTAKIEIEMAGAGTGAHTVMGAVTQSELFLRDRPIDLVEDKGFLWTPEGFRLRGLEVEVGGDPFFLRAAVASGGELSGNLSGTFDGVLLRAVIPEWEPAGRAAGVVELTGTIGRLLFEGLAQIDGGSFHLPGSRSVISDINGAVFLSEGEVSLEDVRFRLMRGAGRCRGTISVREGAAGLRLDGMVDDLQYPLFPGLVPRVDGTWSLGGPVNDLELSGDFVVTRAEVRRQDDLPTLLVNWFGSETPTREDSLRLDLHVRAEETLRAQGPFLRVVGNADLHVTGTDARPGLEGRVEFLEGGEFTLQGIRYELERGQVSFADPTRIDPLLEFQARSRILEYEVWLRLSGTLDRLVPTVSSDPPLNQAEIYSLMAMGQVGEGRAGGALGLSLASSMLTRQLNQTLGGRDSWLVPIDQIRVDPFIESATGNPAARVTVVKQLSPSVTVTLQSNLSAETEEVISLRWYLGSGFFVEGTRDSDSSLGFDLKLRRRY